MIILHFQTFLVRLFAILAVFFFFSKTSERKMERPTCAIVLVGNKTFLFLSPVKWMSNCLACTCFGYSKKLYSLRFPGNWLDVTRKLGVTELVQICMLNEKWNVKDNIWRPCRRFLPSSLTRRPFGPERVELNAFFLPIICQTGINPLISKRNFCL